jgi:hypothetical protein
MRGTLPKNPPSSTVQSTGRFSTTRPDTDAQLPLALTVSGVQQATHRETGRRVRLLISQALEANKLSRIDMAEETGIDPSQLTRALDGDGANLPPAILGFLLARDRKRAFVAGLAAMVGCDLVERRPDLAAENRHLKSELAAIRERLEQLGV